MTLMTHDTHDIQTLQNIFFLLSFSLFSVCFFVPLHSFAQCGYLLGII